MMPMRFYSFLLAGFLFSASFVWETDFNQATQKAKQEHKLILLNFSGSDWCIPCIRMHKGLFQNDVFNRYADSNLVLINADFPRLKKNQLSKEQQKKNEQLADTYNPKGSFPLTLLLDENGKVLQSWEGNPAATPQEFVDGIKANANARH
jgi:thioredoxin-related protein